MVVMSRPLVEVPSPASGNHCQSLPVCGPYFAIEKLESQPVVVQPVMGAPPGEPLYLHVPPGHAKHWRKHCHEYHACDRPVYFVRSAEYEPGFDRARWEREHGHESHDRGHHDEDRDRGDHDHGDHDHDH